MKRTHKLVVLLLLAALTLTGCWDLRPLRQIAAVLGVSIDLGDQPNQLKVTAQVAIVRKLGAQQSSEGDAYINYEASGATTVQDAMRQIQEQLDRELFFGQMRLIALGEDYAKTGIDPGLDYFARDPNVQRVTQVVITKGKSKELMDAKIAVEPTATIYVANMLENPSYSAYEYRSDFGRYLVERREPGRNPGIPVIEVKKEPPKEGGDKGGKGGDEKTTIRVAGTGVFYAGRLQGILSPEETAGLNIIQGEKRMTRVTVPLDGPQNYVTVMVRNVGSDIKISPGLVKDKVKLEGDVIEQTMIRPLSLAENNQTQQAVAAKIKTFMDSAVAKSQQMKGEPFGIGYRIYYTQPNTWDTISSWYDAWPAYRVETEVEMAQLRVRGTNR